MSAPDAGPQGRSLRTYLVTVSTPTGVGELEVPSLSGPDFAGRRGFWTAVAAGWGEPDQVTVASVEDITDQDQA
jgi:hypothetical protein